MSDLEQLLESAAREVEKEAFAYKKPIDIGGLLKLRLLPLLEVAERIADVTTETFDEWRAAKQAALEGKS